MKYVLLFFGLVVGIIGSDTVGGYFYSVSQFYCVITILMVAIAILLFFIPNIENKKMEE